MLATVSSAWSRFPRGVRAPGVAGLLIGLAGCQLVFGVDPNRDGGGGGDLVDARPSSCPTGMAEVTVTIDPVRMQNTVAGVTELVPDSIAPADQTHDLSIAGGEFTRVDLDADGALRFCRPRPWPGWPRCTRWGGWARRPRWPSWWPGWPATGPAS